LFHLLDEFPAFVVLHEHDAQRAAILGHALLLQQREEQGFFLAVVAGVGESDKEFVQTEQGLRCDGFEWRVLSHTIALGLTYLGGKTCIDPQDAEAAPFLEERVSTTGLLPGVDRLRARASTLGAAHLVIPVLQVGREGQTRLVVKTAHARDGFRCDDLIEVEVQKSPSGPAGTELLDAAGDVLRKLIPMAPAASREIAYELVVDRPSRLLDRLREKGARASGSPRDAGAWADAGVL